MTNTRKPRPNISNGYCWVMFQLTWLAASDSASTARSRRPCCKRQGDAQLDQRAQSQHDAQEQPLEGVEGQPQVGHGQRQAATPKTTSAMPFTLTSSPISCKNGLSGRTRNRSKVLQ